MASEPRDPDVPVAEDRGEVADGEPLADVGAVTVGEDDVITSAELVEVDDGGVVADPDDLATIDIDDDDVLTGSDIQPVDDPDDADEVEEVGTSTEILAIDDVNPLPQVAYQRAAPPARAATAPPIPPPKPVARPPSSSEPLAPRQLEIEIPSALDRYVEAGGHGDPSARAEKLAAELEGAEGPQLAELAYELGELQLRELADEAHAVKSYGKALQIDPSLRANLWAIRRVFYRRGLWPNLVKLIGAEIRFVQTDRERAELEVEKGQLLEDRLGQSDEALECYRRAVAHDPTYLPALFALERRVLIEGDRAAQAEVWRALASAVEAPDRRMVYLLDLAEALAETGDLEGAFAALDEAAQLDIDLLAVARTRARLARATDSVEQQIAALEERIRARLAELGAAGMPTPQPRDASTPPDRAEAIRLEVVALRRRQAQLYRDSGDSEGAWIALEQALAAAPGEELVLSGLADLAERLGKFDELAELVEGWQAGEVEPERALALSLRRVSALRRSGKIDQARALLAQLGATSPGYIPVSAVREAEAIADGDLGALSIVYGEMAESAATGSLFGAGGEPDASAAATLHCAAAAAAQLVGDRTRAAALYMAALSEDPGSAAALDGLARCLEAEGDHAAVCDTLAARAGDLDVAGRIRWANAERGREGWARAAEILEPVADQLENEELLWLCVYWERAGDVGRAATTLERAAERAGDPVIAGELLARAARLVEEIDPPRACALYKMALAARPESRLARGLYHALLRQQKDWEQLAEALREAATTGSGTEETAAIWGELAAVLEDRLRQPEEAAAAYVEMASLVPEDPAAVAGLLRVSRGEALVDALERAAASTDPRLRLDALVRLARAHSEADNHGLAIDAAERAAAAETDAGLTTTVSDLLAIEIAARAGEPEPLAEVLERASERQGARLGSALLAAAGWERLVNLDDADTAAGLFERARELAPGSRDALFGQMVCHAARGERSSEAAAATELAQSIEGTQLASALLRSSAALAAVEGDEPEAARRWSEAVQRGPDDLAAAIAATELTAPADPSVAALARNRRIAASQGRVKDRWQLEKARALEAAGRLAEAGRAVLELCQRDEPDPAALDLLAAIARRGGDKRTEAIALAALADAGVGEELLTTSLRRAAELFDDLGDPSSAAAAISRLLELDPGAPELGRLLEICEAADDRARLWELLSARLETDVGDAERAELLRRRGALRRKLGDTTGAARDYEESLAIETEPEALLALASTLAQTRPGDAAEALRRYLATDPEADAQADAEVRLAEILAESSGDLAGAAAELASAISLRPDDLDLRERHVTLLTRAGDANGAIAALEELAAFRTTATERSQDRVRIAAIARDSIGDRERAVRELDQARQLDPLNLDAVKQLVELVGGNPERMEAILSQVSTGIWLALESDPGARGLYQKLAAVAGWRGHDDRRDLALAAADALGTRAGSDGVVTTGPPSLSGGPIDAQVWAALAPNPAGFLDELWAVLAPVISALRDPEPAAVGLGRADRTKGRQLSTDFPILARMIERLMLDVEVYVGSSRTEWARVTSAERPLMFLSSDVATADTPGARFLLGSAVAMARDHSGTLEHIDQADLGVLLSAAATVVGVEPPEAIQVADRKAVSSTAERLDRAMSRRAGKDLQALAGRFSEITDPVAWRRSTLAVARRFGLALAGDIRAALACTSSGKVVQNDPVALDLIRFAASPEHITIREVLGYGQAR